MISLMGLIVSVAIVGLILWLVETFIPMDVQVKKFLQVAVIIILILWLISVLNIGNIGGASI